MSAFIFPFVNVVSSTMNYNFIILQIMSKLTFKERLAKFWETLCYNSGGINTIVSIIKLAIAIIALA